MYDWTEFDFDSTIRDFDFTHRAAQGFNGVLDSQAFYDMDTDMIFQFLLNGLELVSFKDYLKRYLYERAQIPMKFSEVRDDVYQEIIISSFQENAAPYSFVPTTKRLSMTVKGWLKQDSVKRSTIFLLGFGLRMKPAEVSQFLTKVLKESDFDFYNAEEVIYWYCFHEGLEYANARELLEEYESLSAAKKVKEENWEELIAKSDFQRKSRKYIMKYLTWLKYSGIHENRISVLYEEYCRLLRRTQEAVARYNEENSDSGSGKKTESDNITGGDIEKLLYSGVPTEKNGNLKKMSSSLLAKHFNQNRLSRNRIDSVYKQKLLPERFDLMTLLFLIYALEVEPDFPNERYIQFLDEMNSILQRCRMLELYPANPYDTFILLCILSDYPLGIFSDIWELSYQQEEI